VDKPIGGNSKAIVRRAKRSAYADGAATFIQRRNGSVDVEVDQAQVEKGCREDVGEDPDHLGNMVFPEPAVRVLSVVGDIVAYEVRYGGWCGQISMISAHSWWTFSMRTGKDVPLDQLFHGKDINQALAQDTFLAKERAKSDRNYDLDIVTDTTEYMIHSVAGDKLRVRIKLNGAGAYNRRSMFLDEMPTPKLGLLLRPKNPDLLVQAKKDLH